MSNRISAHYDESYFKWQEPMGKFGGWANQSKFAEFISPDGLVELFRRIVRKGRRI